MTKGRLITLSAVLGAVVPLGFLCITSYTRDQRIFNVHLAANIDRLMLMFWPSSLMQMANDGAHPDDPRTYMVMLLSIAVNALLYALIAFCIWLGVKKSSVFLLIPIFLVVGFWWELS